VFNDASPLKETTMKNLTTQGLVALLREETDRLEKQARSQISYQETSVWTKKTKTTTLRVPEDMVHYLNAMSTSVCLDRSKIVLQFIQDGITAFRNKASQETLDSVENEFKKLSTNEKQSPEP
jgi:ABC-type uncharacterized transport system ATPase component